MAWVETEALSFIARHESADADDAKRTLDALEDLRLRLEDRFEHAPGEITVVVHPTPAWLNAAHPFLPAARLAAAPAGRRYLAGWAMAANSTCSTTSYLDRRAAGEDSLARAAGHRRTPLRPDRRRRQQRRLPPPWGPRRFRALPALGLAGRGRAAVLRRPGPAVPCCREHAMRGRSPRRSRPSPATRSSSAAQSSTCSNASGAPTPASCSPRACAARAPSATSRSPSARARARSHRSGGGTCARRSRAQEGPTGSTSCAGNRHGS